MAFVAILMDEKTAVRREALQKGQLRKPLEVAWP